MELIDVDFEVLARAGVSPERIEAMRRTREESQ